MLKKLAFYFEVFKVTVKNNVVSEFIYRSNFFALTIADLIWVFVEAGFFEIIYSNITAINGWTRPQTYFFLGIFVSSDTLFTIFFQRSFWQFPELVNHGELDVLLTKPASAIFLACTRYFNFSQFSNLILGFWIIHHFGDQAGFQGGIYWVGVLFWIFVGLIAQLLLRFSFVVWSFWLERGFSVSVLYYQFYSLANKPDGMYPNFFRYLIKTALPFAFIGSVPAQAILGKATAQDYLFLVASLSGYFFICSFLWKRGLRRYQSASS